MQKRHSFVEGGYCCQGILKAIAANFHLWPQWIRVQIPRTVLLNYLVGWAFINIGNNALRCFSFVCFVGTVESQPEMLHRN